MNNFGAEAKPEEILQSMPDDSYNLMRLLKVISKCPRCLNEFDEIGGIRFTLTEENSRRVQESYSRWKEEKGD